MITTLLGVGVIALVASAVGLLALGTTWKRAGGLGSLCYALGLSSIACVAGAALWHPPTAALLGAGSIFLAAISAIAWLERDWNPPAQALLGVIATNCLAFLVFTTTFAFSGDLPVAAIPEALLVTALEAFAFVLLLMGTHETLDVAGRVRWHRRDPEPLDATYRPFVSVHVPTHNEPPELVIETLRALQRLRYEHFEVLVIDNNTDDEALWRPIERFCATAGFRFVHVQDWPGFKAGALNLALDMTDPRAEAIAVVDADFVVAPEFLNRCAPYFSDPSVTIVQTSQEFRVDSDSRYFRRLALTYRAFDEVTMPGRNERNAIIFAGTMGLLRRSAVEEAGRWAEWCVTEDAELSLRMLARGQSSVYLDRSFGRGVMPLTFGALKRQRYRWCFGGIQILRRHRRLMVLGRGTEDDGTPLALTRAQRYGYLAAALQWFQPLLTVAMSALLTVGVVSAALGHALAIRPLVGFFIATPAAVLVVTITKSLWGLRARLHVTWMDALGTCGIWFALSWAVALASLKGVLRTEGAFLRTPKFVEGQSLRQAVAETRSELIAAATLTIVAALGLRSIPGTDGLFLASLCLWGALIFWAAPVAAFSAARATLGTPGLERRRSLEWARGHTRWRRRSSRLVAVAVGAAAAVLLLGASLGGGPGGATLGALAGHLEIPRTPGSQGPGGQGPDPGPGGDAHGPAPGTPSTSPQSHTSSVAGGASPVPATPSAAAGGSPSGPGISPTSTSSPRPSATPSVRTTEAPSLSVSPRATPTGVPSRTRGPSPTSAFVSTSSAVPGGGSLLLLFIPLVGAGLARRASSSKKLRRGRDVPS